MPSPQNLVEDADRIEEIVRSAERIAVLGIRSEAYSDRPAFFVAEYLQEHGAQIIPVPVYEPDVTQILGQKVYRKLTDVPRPVDIVDVFRRPKDIPPHVGDLLALRPRVVWFQLGIRHDDAARALADAGILVVQDHCLKVEWRRYRN
jgi:predicted CoA-binding protein